MENVDVQPHIRLRKEQVHPVAIVVGDPARAHDVAVECDTHRELAWFREYRSFSCTYKGISLLVCSHGVGSAGASICFEELIYLGVKTIIRAGTAGALKPSVRQGDIIVVHAAVREDGVTALHVPPGYPAVADLNVFNVLKKKSEKSSIGDRAKCGIAVTSDAFYKPVALPWTLETWARSNVDCVEMEISALFVIAKMRGARAGALCCIDGSPLNWEKEGNYDPSGQLTTTGKAAMITIALEAAHSLCNETPKGN